MFDTEHVTLHNISPPVAVGMRGLCRFGTRENKSVLIRSYQCDAKSVVAFRPNCLDDCCRQARLTREQCQEISRALNLRIGGIGINDCPVTHHVIGNDECASTGQLQRPL